MRRVLDILGYIALSFWVVSFVGFAVHAHRVEDVFLRLGIIVGLVVVFGRSVERQK